MNRLANWLDTATNQLSSAGFTSAAIADDLASRTGRGGTLLQSHRWVGPVGTDVRAALITSPKAQVLNIMGYPLDALNVPVFAMEVVLFGDAVRVAVIDLQPASTQAQALQPLRENVLSQVEPIWRQYQRHLTHGGELPPWAQQQFMPTCIYSRCENLDQWPTLTLAFNAYLQCWLHRFVSQESGQATAVDAVAAYQQHHVAHTPGRPFLRSIFGEAWAEAYVSQFMYPSHAWPNHAHALASSSASHQSTSSQFAHH